MKKDKVKDLLNQAITLLDQEKYPDALKTFSQVVELEPNNEEAWIGRGDALSRLNRHEEALQSYEKAIELEPKNVWGWNRKGGELSRLNRHEEALQSYEKAIELDPKSIWGWKGKGYTLKQLGRYEEALQSYEKALPQKPNIGALQILLCIIVLTWPLPMWLHYWTNLGALKISITTIAVMCLFSYLLLHMMNREIQNPKRLNVLVISIVVVISSLTFLSFFFLRLYESFSPQCLYLYCPNERLMSGWPGFPKASFIASGVKALSLSSVIIIFAASLASYLIIKGLMRHVRDRREYLMQLEKAQIRFREEQVRVEKEREEQERQEIERRKKAEDELDGKIIEALKIMNSSQKPYSNEDEANHELFLLLRKDMPDADIHYQPKISGTRTADLTIGNTIIEGKLDLLHQTEADRLVGQLEDYCSDERYKVKIVVYGEIKPEFYQRIQARIERLYFGKVALIHLPSPTRKRRESNQSFPRE
jgi:tetratricopeptide (TPR) repeat protein